MTKKHNEVFTAMKKMKKSGRLKNLTNFKPSGLNSINLASREEWMLLAAFAIAVLEQRAIGCPYHDSQLVYALPPVPQPARVKVPGKMNVKRAGDKSTRNLFVGMNMMHEDFVKALCAACIEVEE